MSFRNGGDQIGVPRQCQCGRKSTNDHCDLSFQSELRQGIINGTFVQIAVGLV